jgi:hypothetical protein
MYEYYLRTIDNDWIEDQCHVSKERISIVDDILCQIKSFLGIKQVRCWHKSIFIVSTLEIT